MRETKTREERRGEDKEKLTKKKNEEAETKAPKAGNEGDGSDTKGIIKDTTINKCRSVTKRRT